MGDQEVVELTFETSARRDIFVQELEKILKQRGGGNQIALRSYGGHYATADNWKRDLLQPRGHHSFNLNIGLDILFLYSFSTTLKLFFPVAQSVIKVRGGSYSLSAVKCGKNMHSIARCGGKGASTPQHQAPGTPR